jgi:hypothetical protein
MPIPHWRPILEALSMTQAATVKRQGWGESCSIRLWEREAYVLLKGARASPNGEVHESKHVVEPGANSTGPCGIPTADSHQASPHPL